jgi:hypothetical protein
VKFDDNVGVESKFQGGFVGNEGQSEGMNSQEAGGAG